MLYLVFVDESKLERQFWCMQKRLPVSKTVYIILCMYHQNGFYRNCIKPLSFFFFSGAAFPERCYEKGLLWKF